MYLRCARGQRCSLRGRGQRLAAPSRSLGVLCLLAYRDDVLGSRRPLLDVHHQVEEARKHLRREGLVGEVGLKLGAHTRSRSCALRFFCSTTLTHDMAIAMVSRSMLTRFSGARSTYAVTIVPCWSTPNVS